MKSSMLFMVLQSLTKKELRLLEKFVKSPFHNSRKDVIDLFMYLFRKIEDGGIIQVNKENAYKKIYKGEAYDEKKFRYLISFLFKVVKSFLSYQEYKTDNIADQYYLVRAFRHRGLQKPYEQAVRNTDTLHARQTIKDADYHLQNFKLEYEKLDLSKRAPTPKIAEQIQSIDNELTIYYVASTLKINCFALSYQSSLLSDYQQNSISRILAIIQEKDYLRIPAVAIIYHIYMMLAQKDADIHFQELRKLIKEKSDCFPTDQISGAYIAAINYCIRQANLGKSNYTGELLNLYKEGLAAHVFIVNGILSQFTYKNIVMAGLMQNEFEWVEQFIYDYKDYIEESDRENSFLYNLAIMYYRKHDFHQAMDLLKEVKFKDVFNDLAPRRMLLKIYFELKEIDALNSLLESFKNFIYRHKELGYHKTTNLNLIKFTKRLLNLKIYDQDAAEKLKMEIEATNALAEKKWLLEQF